MVSNVQIAPPRHVVDSVSEVASAESAAESPRWQTVGKDRSKRMIDRGRTNVETVGSAVTPSRGKQNQNPRQIKLRSSNAVVVIRTRENNKAPYSEILKRAKQRVNIKDLGIVDPNIRLAASGGLLLEIPGPEGHSRADALVDRLRRELNEEVVVSRPVKFGELRLKGIDPSVGQDEITRALAAAGGCASEQIRLGPIRKNIRGVQSAWAKCPLSSAIKLADLQKIEIGWSVMYVKILRGRPTQCFKCWGYGHVRSMCRSSVDKSGNCFNCGEAGHNIGNCSSAPKCIVCKESGRASNHRMGSTTCGSLEAARRNSRNRPGDIQGSANQR